MGDLDSDMDMPYGEEPHVGLGPPNVCLRSSGYVFRAHLCELPPGTRFFDVAEEDAAGIFHLNLDNEDSDLVHWLVIYLCQQRVTPGLQERLDDAESMLDTCHEILHIARAYGLWDVQHIIYVPLRELFKEQCHTLFIYHQAMGEQVPPEGQINVLEEDFVVEFVRLARTVYSFPLYRPLRRLFVAFLVQGRGCAMKHDVFRNLACSTPLLLADIFAWLARSIRDRSGW